MNVTHWLESIKSSLFRSPSPARRRSMRTVEPTQHVSRQVEGLEDRTLLSVNSAFFALDSELVVEATADDGIIITVSNGNVLVNNVEPTTGPLLATDVQAIRIQGSSGENIIDLSAVTAAQFTALNSVVIDGGQGNDLIIGSELDDLLIGGHGDDTLIGGLGDDTINGGDGNDLINAEVTTTTTVIPGSMGADTVTTHTISPRGGEGDDSILGRDGDDTILGGDGNDLVDAGDGDDVVGGNFDRVVTTTAGGTTTEGITFVEFADAGDDSIFGGDGADTIVSGTGADTINGGFGDDYLDGNDDDDVLFGGSGFDTILGGLGNDRLNGQGQDDELHGGDGDDTLIGGSHNDLLFGDAGDDSIEGDGATINTLWHGDDTIDGGAGADTVDGQGGRDSINGGSENDLLAGGTGDDFINGDFGDDTILGQAGADTLIGGGGADVVDGGAGNDLILSAIFQVFISIDDVQVTEGDAGMVTADFTVTLSEASDEVITVDFTTVDGTATAGMDYVPTSGTLTFAPGTLSQTISVPIISDDIMESDEMFFVDLSNAVGANITTARGTATIIDDDTPANLVTFDAVALEPDPPVGMPVGFLPASNLTIPGFNPGTEAVVTADFNGDGNLDLAMANTSASTVSVFLGNGDGTFGASMEFNVGTGPVDLVAADLDGDGDIDLATANSTGDNVSVLLNAGTGGAFAVTEFTVGNQPVGITFGDFDADGDIDLATVNQSDNNITVLENTGTGTFNAAVIAGNTGVSPRDIIAVDLSGDGDLDLAVASGFFAGNAMLSILTGAGGLAFNPAVSTPLANGPTSIDFADLDGDTDEDLIIGLTNGSVSIALNDGAGGFGTPANVMVGSDIQDVVALDVDNDGDLDVAVVDQTANNVVLLLNDGAGALTNAGTFAVANGPQGMAVGDFNNDGLPDVATANNANFAGTVSILLNSTGTTAVTVPVLVTLSRPETVPVTVDFATADGTATAGIDYSPVSGTLTFMPGETAQIINVAVLGDNNPETDETFTINLSNPTNANIQVGQSTVTIFDNDSGLRIFVGDAIAAEEDMGMAIFPVNLTQPAPANVSFDFATANGTATAGTDYMAVSGTVTIPAGMTTAMIVVPILNDSVNEGPENFFVNLTNPSGMATLARTQVVGTIVEDASGMMMPGMPSPPTGIQTETIEFDELPNQPVDGLTFMNVTFDFTVNGIPSTDANFNVGAPGSTMFLQDPVLEGNGTGILTLDFAVPVTMLQFGVARDTMMAVTPGLTVELFDENGSSLGTTPLDVTPLVTFAEAQFTHSGTAVSRAVLNFAASGNPARFAIDNLTYQFDVGPGIMIDDVTIPVEGDTEPSTATFTVMLDQPSTEIVRVNYATADGTATAGADYVATSGTLIFLPGETTQTIDVTILPDDLDEPDETFFVNLFNEVGGVITIGQGVGTILNDDPPLDPIGDTLIGGAGNDTVLGAEGDDLIQGLSGDDVLDGDGGNDTIFGGAGRDLLLGGDGNDVLDGGKNSDTVLGQAGNDTITWSDGDGTESVDGGSGFDQLELTTSSKNDRFFVGERDGELEVIHRIPGIALHPTELEDTLRSDQVEHLSINSGAGADRVIVDDLSAVSDVQLISADLGGGRDLFDASAQLNASIRMSVLGGNGADTIIGGAGHDTLNGQMGNDRIFGGPGNDMLIGGLGVDSIEGGSGNDNIDGGEGRDFLRGGDGNDTITGGPQNDDIYGGAGDDRLDGGDGSDRVFGDAGNDTITGGNGADTLDGGAGADSIHGDTSSLTTGQEGSDSISGGDGDDTLIGGLGADTVSGGSGHDFIAGGDGMFMGMRTTLDGGDFLNGNSGNDTIFGEEGDDSLLGGSGDDSLDGGVDNDQLNGNSGNDTMKGGHGNDFMRGGSGEDTLNGGHGDDTLHGQDGGDALAGHDGNDVLNGGGGADTLHGGDGNDTLRGGADRDLLIGHDGMDDLDGQGASYDTLVGGDSFDILEDNGGTDLIDNAFLSKLGPNRRSALESWIDDV